MFFERPTSLLFRVLVATVLLGLALLSPRAHAQSAADVAAARELFKQGIQASKDGRWSMAIDRLSRSLELKPAPITHYTLAVAQQKSNEFVEALENFRAFLISPPEESTDAYREPAKAAVAELEKQVARVQVFVEPAEIDDLTVHIDGNPVPLAALGSARLVNPGMHYVKATAPRYKEATQTVEVEEGGSAEVRIELELAPVQEVAPPPPDDGPTSSGTPDGADQVESSFPVGPVVLLASGVAVFGAGLAVGMIGLSEAKDAPASEGDEADAARTKGIAGDVVAGVGIAAAAAGVIWLIVYDGSPEPAAAAAGVVRPWQQGPVGGVQVAF